MMILAVLIVLHGLDQMEITINPANVTSLRQAHETKPNKLFSSEVECMIGLTDGKFVTVIETCETVRKLIEGK